MATPRTVLITGSNRGIGLAFAEHYTSAGWRVIATVRDTATADKTQAMKRPAYVWPRSSWAFPSLLVNNAGIGRYGGLEDATKQELMDCFEANTVGPLLVTQALLPNLKLSSQTTGSAIIAQVSSQLGSITDNVSAGYYGYRASKAALNMVNASLAVDLKRDKIIAVALHPGFVATDMNGHTGIIQPHESAEGMSKVIAKLTLHDSGRFYSNEGEQLR